jgi:hypothetical protein
LDCYKGGKWKAIINAIVFFIQNVEQQEVKKITRRWRHTVLKEFPWIVTMTELEASPSLPAVVFHSRAYLAYVSLPKPLITNHSREQNGWLDEWKGI